MPAPHDDRHPLAERHRACAATLQDQPAQGHAPWQTAWTPSTRVPVEPLNTTRPAAPHPRRS